MKRLLALPILIAALTIAGFASVTVSSPTNGATVQSPVKFVASAASSYRIIGMVIYVDSRNVYSTQAASLNTGVAMSAGSHAIVVKAWTSMGTAYTDSMTLVVTSATSAPAVKVSTASLASATAGSAYTATLQASGGTSPYTWSLASGSLPAGLALSASGTISGTPSASCASSFSVAVKDSESSPQTATATLSITVAAPPAPAALKLTTSTLASGTAGSGYSATLQATGGTSPYTWSLASGSLPAGLALSSSGTISGTPSASGTSSFSVTVKDSESSPQTSTAAFSLTIAAATPAAAALQLTTSTLANGTAGSGYSTALQATGGTSPYTWSLASGSLPAGLALSSSGTISGTPSASGTSSFSITVKDSESSPQAATAALSLTIAAATPANASCSGTCYYVSPTGNDSNSGTSTSAPWKTIAKVQSFQSSLKPGDSVLFQAGGVWSEELDITNMNGSSGSPITIGSYGSGAMPVIDGGQTSSANGRNYCIDAMNTTYKWITVSGIECRNAYKQGITFQAYSGTGTNGVGIVVQNSYIHHDGDKACTTCGATPASDPGGYLNQLDAQLTTGVQFLNNTIDHCGGHNCLEVHYDFGGPVISGNIVGTAAPYCNHMCIDQKGAVGGQILNNIVTCPSCGSMAAAIYTENGGSTYSTKAETAVYTGNIVYNLPAAGVGYQVEVGGTCPSGPCTINAKFYNNTFYSSNSSSYNFMDSSCTGHTLDIQKNIVDGGGTDIHSNCSTTWNYNADGGVNPISGNPKGSNDLTNVNPQYVNASSGNFVPQNTTILSYGSSDSVTPFAYLGGMQ